LDPFGSRWKAYSSRFGMRSPSGLAFVAVRAGAIHGGKKVFCQAGKFVGPVVDDVFVIDYWAQK
jgi:hypothetical protein